MQQGILLSLHLPGSILQLLTALPDVASPGRVIGQPAGRSRRAGQGCRGHQPWLQREHHSIEGVCTACTDSLQRRAGPSWQVGQDGDSFWHLHAPQDDLPESMELPAASAKLAPHHRRPANTRRLLSSIDVPWIPHTPGVQISQWCTAPGHVHTCLCQICAHRMSISVHLGLLGWMWSRAPRVRQGSGSRDTLGV